jgi:hypothetical protein
MEIINRCVRVILSFFIVLGTVLISFSVLEILISSMSN